MNPSISEHRQSGRQSLAIALITVSDTRTIETDTSGALIIELATNAGHRIVERSIVPDEPDKMRPILLEYGANEAIDVILMTGGTGISPRDQTYETVSQLLTKPVPGYGELFRMLSYAEIGAACILSRAVGGLMGAKVVLVMPGSRAAVSLAMTKIILPELTHLVSEARKV